MQNADERVRVVAAGIATGDVMTYGEIGRITGLHPRQVGGIVSRIADSIPWWRIVHADGRPATCHDGRATILLVAEGVPFVGGRVDWRDASASAAPPTSGNGPSGLCRPRDEERVVP